MPRQGRIVSQQVRKYGRHSSSCRTHLFHGPREVCGKLHPTLAVMCLSIARPPWRFLFSINSTRRLTNSVSFTAATSECTERKEHTPNAG